MPPPPDLTHRADPATLPEWMDEPCSYEEFRACLHSLEAVNRLTLGYRPTLGFLQRLLARRPAGAAPLRILDVGFGGGGLLRQVERWAARRGVAVALTGIDLNPFAARAAAELSPSSAITWLTGDAFTYSAPVDVVLSSLFTHHLAEPEIVRFLAWMEARAAAGWFINDLCREPAAMRGFTLAARLLRWHPFVQHDGPVSFRRSFREPDWQRLLAAAGIPAAAVELRRFRPGRLCVARLR